MAGVDETAEIPGLRPSTAILITLAIVGVSLLTILTVAGIVHPF